MKRVFGHLNKSANSRFALQSASTTRSQFNADHSKHKWLLETKGSCLINPKRGVNTISPLTAVFNSKPSVFVNFSISKESVGLFGAPELRAGSGFYLMKQNAVMEAEDLLAEGCSAQRKRKMVEVFDELSNVLCRVADMAEFVRLAHPETRYKMAAQEASFAIGALVEQLNVNKELYDALRLAVEEGDVVPTTEVDDHVAKLFLFDFEQSGIHLDSKKRKRVFELNEYILVLGQHFMSDCHTPRKMERSELPPELRNYLSMTGSSVTVTGLLSDSSSEGAREAAYRVYQLPEHQQEVLLSRLLCSRRDMAQLCGFPSFAHRALRGSLAETPEMVGEFLNETSEAVRPLAAGDYDLMRDMKMRDNCANKLGMWDVSYYTALGKHLVLCGGDLTGTRATNVSKAPSLSHYFPLGTVMEGLNSLLQQLYGVRLDLCKTPPGETWADDVHKLAVVEEDGSLLGHIYCDFSERAGKSNQDCHFTIRGGKVMPDGSYQTPCVVVQLALPPASWSGPPLLTPGMVENLFHEMGHALHSMMARTRYQHVTGTRCSTDFAEVPSILMEFFASDPRVIRTFARHFKTGEVLPENVLQDLIRSRAAFAASELQTQVYYAAVDQRYHSNSVAWEDGVSTSEVLREEHEKHYGLPYVENTAWQHRFSHFVGYGGKYYAYLVSRSVASWIWETYFQADPFSREAGERYRKEVLQHGGGVPPRLLVEGFLHRELTPHNLSRALMADLDRKRMLLRG